MKRMARIVLISERGRFLIDNARLVSVTYKDGTVLKIKDILRKPDLSDLSQKESEKAMEIYNSDKDKFRALLRNLTLPTSGTTVVAGIKAMVCDEHKRFIDKLLTEHK